LQHPSRASVYCYTLKLVCLFVILSYLLAKINKEITYHYCLPIFSMNVFIFIITYFEFRVYHPLLSICNSKCQSLNVFPGFFLLFFSLLLRFGGAKLHILFSSCKYFFLFIEKIFFSSSLRTAALTPVISPSNHLLKKREGKDTSSLSILKIIFRVLLISRVYY
jgi:hypothetical protein